MEDNPVKMPWVLLQITDPELKVFSFLIFYNHFEIHIAIYSGKSNTNHPQKFCHRELLADTEQVPNMIEGNSSFQNGLRLGT